MATGEFENIFDASKLSYKGDFDSQVEEILERIRLTRDQVEAMQYLYDDLKDDLSDLWPGCTLHIFGSIVTGLGIKTSDMDVYVDISGIKHQVKRAWQLNVEPVIAAKFKILKRYWIYDDVFSITKAKVPILKFLHRPTRVRCDVNFSNRGGVKNSELISFLLTQDPRLLPLAIIIKFWSKVHNFTGTNLLPNYSLSLMIIFYLQHLNILPSIWSMQMKVTPEYVENWNMAFSRDIQLPITNNDSIYSLLGGFFKFYTEYKFDTSVISPYQGCHIDKKCFVHQVLIPPTYELYKSHVSEKICQPFRVTSPICLQDPFDHSRNCTIGVHPKLVSKIINHFVFASQMFEERAPDEFLTAIFLEDPLTIEPPPLPQPNNAFRITKHPTIITNNPKHQKKKVWKHKHKKNKLMQNKIKTELMNRLPVKKGTVKLE